MVQRLRAAASALGVDTRDAGETGDLLAELVGSLRRDPRRDRVWLALVAVCGGMPLPGLVESVARRITVESHDRAVGALLDLAFESAIEMGQQRTRLEVVTEGVLIDVDFTVKNPEFITGIQRVVRETATLWIDDDAFDREVIPVAWSDGGTYRRLSDDEAHLLRTPGSDTSDSVLTVPFGVPVVLFEVPSTDHSLRLAAAAEAGVVSVRAVGYDCIPIASAEMVPVSEVVKFSLYLDMLKWADRVAGISQAAADEFAGFRRALAAQGIAGPTVDPCPLPHTLPTVAAERSPVSSDIPEVLCVGSIGRRKNQAAVVEAAELLWRDGLQFRLRLIGHVQDTGKSVAALVTQLASQGRPIRLERAVSDETLHGAYAAAHCLVFPSLHEGFGLPVAEALSYGVPVVTSEFGSLSELAADQGGLLVDPEDVGAVAEAMRRLLADGALHAELVAQARGRSPRTWADYARALWAVLVR